MSGRLLSARLLPLVLPLAQRANITAARHFHHGTSSAAGLLRADSAIRVVRRRIWPAGYTPFSNVVAVRNVSFVRILPRLLIKFARIPALFAGATITGLAYVQYQATQAGNYALDVFDRTKDGVVDIAGGIFGGAKDIAGQTWKGWENTKEQVELPGWVQKLLRIHEEIGDGPNEGGNGGPGGEPPNEARMAAVAGATAAAYGYDQSTEEDPKAGEESARDDQMMALTKKMIEIRSILQTVGQSNALNLPSIVVIGSQSSGKSSVLEAIVGHEFLPKGSNMVTRRPIELTLVNTPDARAEYGEFPALGLGKITDFSHIQRTLTELNLAVPDSQCVSDDPIQLTISSPHVPDLSLIDLPGYIQVVGHDQPVELKQKIADLCDKYIQPPNVILAISAADVDLANSTALRASRRVDPRGERTIGVVTKMDLVDSTRGASILTDRKYPLRLGYVGVVSRVPPVTTGLFKKGSGNISSAISRNENAFFSAHPLEFSPEAGLSVGTTTLRKKLMQVLEQTMAASLATTRDAIHQELEEATYEFKVQYNDRPLSAESYLAESLDGFKHSFKEFTDTFGRPQVREMLKEELDQRVLDLLAAKYWNKPITNLSPALVEPESLADLPRADSGSLYWHRKLDASTSSLTKLGIGRVATTVVANAIQANVDHLIGRSTFATHPFARQAITEAASGILNERFYSTSDQVENCIKPYKFEIDVEDGEWARGREHAAGVLKNELHAVEDAVRNVEKVVGGKRKLRDVMGFVERARKGEVMVGDDGATGAGGFSSELLTKGKEALFLSDRATLLRLRLSAIKSPQCANKNNKYFCPEIFLDVVSTKLVSTAVLFLNVELLSEFVYQFPRELDVRLGRGLSREEVERFAREDSRIKAHLDVIRRKELLELVLEKMEGVRDLESTKRERERARGKRMDEARESQGKEKSRWGIF
ncbi:P-loop containing nucleoside triphosphate hydrolase protein [Amylocarpus encephaloides]|uniref:dynamin GTPase n=1 Tax=Amylocarpus encephaloides TaxID=45428 RepID=A0A9P8C139_9HELO|nr:P-loop containing nucleoside triphosphate hydrolase protein [Amylocarpus encephaloides]